jgi:hypothetical protein
LNDIARERALVNLVNSGSENETVAERSALPVGILASDIAVIGVGFGRTGTLSLREALVRLGFGPCDHMLENFEHPERFALWQAALRRKRAGEPIDWRPLLSGYRAIVDWPGAYFWRELIAAHPDAKVILTVRDPERWYDSTTRTIFRLRSPEKTGGRERAMLRLLLLAMPKLRSAPELIDDIIWSDTFGGRFADREHALRVFTDHSREVQAAVPSDRLLVFDVKEGWGPLCAFLGVPVPNDEPFPHVNDAESFRRQMRERLTQSVTKVLRPVILAAAGVAALSWVKRRAGRGRGGSTR